MVDDPLRRAVLIEFVAIDFVTRVERGETISLLDYLALDSEFGPPEQLPVQLLLLEFLSRQRSANPIEFDLFASWFPVQAEELKRRVEAMNPPPQGGTMICTPVDGEFEIAPISKYLDRRPTFNPIQDANEAIGNRSIAKGTIVGRDPDLPEDRIELENGYVLIRRIGRGNFGEVWLSEAPGGIEVALKIVRLPAGPNSSHLELRSLDLMKRLRHPFLIQVQAFWVTPERILIAMELADQSLQDRARECPNQSIPLPELLGYMAEAAEGIDHLHREHVVHRDIKPDNLLLLKGHVKVADFGLAKLLDETGLTVIATQVVGSPMYMAPEVWSKKPEQSSDQYSLAVAYAELRMGSTPFSASSLVEAMQEHLYGQPKLSELSQPEQAVLRRALSKNANDRFASCSEMVSALTDAATPRTALQHGMNTGDVGLAFWKWMTLIAAIAGLVVTFFVYRFDSSPISIPKGTEPSKGYSRVESEGRIWYSNIDYLLPSGQRIEFVLIPRKTTKDPSTFYIMKGEVTNRWYAEFAAANPEQIRPNSLWRQGALKGSTPNGVDGEFMDYSVVGVNVEEAQAFAKWIGGLLPSDQEWDKAAGAFEKQPQSGPFKTDGKDLCIDRVSEGPVASMASRDDISPFEVHDLAGNVTELTRSILGRANPQPTIPLSDRIGRERIILRGNSYHDPVPWTFDQGDDGTPPSLQYDESKPYVGFRVVIELI